MEAAAAAVVFAELFWVFYKQVITSITWPSAKQRIPFPQIDVGPALDVGGVTIQRSAIFTVAALAVCALLLWLFINRTRLGRGMQAVSQDPDTARLMGINVDLIIVVAFALGAVLAAIAGISQGFQNNNIDFRMGFLAGLKAFTAAVLGGIGNVYGAVVGGLVLGVVEALATQYIPGQFGGGSWKDVWAFVILILVLVFRPQGLLGEGGGSGMSEAERTPAEPDSAAQQPVKPIAWPAGIAGVVLVIVGSFLSWSYDPSILNDLSINLFPGGLQILAIIALLALVLLLAERGL